MDEMFQEPERKRFDIKAFFKRYLTDIVILLAVIVYITRGMIVITETGKTVMQVLGDGAIACFFALMISQLFGMRGIASGELSTPYTDAKRDYFLIKAKIIDYADRLEDWCAEQNEAHLSRRQADYLSRAGITLAQFRNPDFNPENYSEKRQVYIKKSQRAKLVDPLSVDRLMVLAERDTEKKHRSTKDFMRQSSIVNAATKMGIGLAVGYYSVRLATNFDYRIMIWYAVQAIIFLASGMYRYWQSFMFVTNDVTAELETKKTYLEQYYAYCVKENNNERNERNGHEEVPEPVSAQADAAGAVAVDVRAAEAD